MRTHQQFVDNGPTWRPWDMVLRHSISSTQLSGAIRIKRASVGYWARYAFWMMNSGSDCLVGLVARSVCRNIGFDYCWK